MRTFYIEEGEMTHIVFEDYQLVLRIRWPLDGVPVFQVYELEPVAIQKLVRSIRNRQIRGKIEKSTIARFQEAEAWNVLLRELGRRLQEESRQQEWLTVIGKAGLIMADLKERERRIEEEMTGWPCPGPIDYLFELFESDPDYLKPTGA